MAKKIVALALFWMVVGGCTSQEDARYARDGVQYGVTEGVFRGRWWSYFERGASFLNGGFYQEAVTDFQEALQGRSKDTWRARTYGLHFVEYFPNRELGIAYFHLGQLDAAEQSLRTSLEQVDTVRARHYLDQIIRERIAKGLVKDDAAPSVSMAAVQSRVLSSQNLPVPDASARPATASSEREVYAQAAGESAAPAPPVSLMRGAAPQPVAERALNFSLAFADDIGVAKVEVQGKEVPQRGSETELEVKQEILLDEGTHEIEVKAIDLADKESVQKVPVVVDLTGPTLGVFSPIEPTVTPEGSVILEGATVDKNGVSNVAVGQNIIAEAAGDPRLEFDTDLPLADGENTFVLAARDVAGNETRSAIKVFRGDPESVEAKLWLQKMRQEQDTLQMASAGGNAAAVQMVLSATSEPVNEIRLKSPNAERPYRHNRTLRVAGEVLSPAKITALTINGQPFTDLVGAPKESFNKRLPMDQPEGKVKVAIHAEDEAGNVLDKEVEVDVRPVTLDTQASKMPVAVLAFSGAGIEPQVAETLRLEAQARLAGLNRFFIVERANLQDVLTEQQLASALADPNAALELGRLTNAYAFLVADLLPRDANGLEIKARVVDASTSGLVAILDEFIEDKSDATQIARACDSLAAQFADLYPRLSGEVLAVRDQQLVVNWSSEDGVREGAYLLVVQETEPFTDPDTGEVLMPGDFVPVSRGRVEAVTDTNSRAVQVQQEQEGVTLDAGMPAVTM